MSRLADDSLRGGLIPSTITFDDILVLTRSEHDGAYHQNFVLIFLATHFMGLPPVSHDLDLAVVKVLRDNLVPLLAVLLVVIFLFQLIVSSKCAS